MRPIAFLAAAIVFEVIATASLRASNGFRNVLPSVVVVIGYGAAFYFLSLCLQQIPLGVAYAVWSGVGTVLITLVGVVLYRQALSPAVIAGMALVVLGVVLINLGSPAVDE
ncbi:DMT family transporter [Cellulomonas hominis]|uniref:DMT family transporter n=1 Tax=Cellulomonas hominis TaxID=156981 RepID=UPI001BA3190E|nr:multidrug efflux SMR transporter [Cellulomonas hominis]VTR75992.1 Multidrug resistance protein EbrA [Cellulomonas hominis]